MSPERMRILAAAHRVKAAQHALAAATYSASVVLRELNAELQAGYDREVAGHPDLAELNVRLDGFYS